MFRLVKYSFKFTIKTRGRWRHQKRLWRHHFDLSNFRFASGNLTLISNLSHQYVIFLNFGYDVTSNDVTDFKEKNFNLNLRTNY